MFNSLRPTTVLECLSAAVSRWLIPARLFAILVLSGALSLAFGQTRPVEPGASDAGPAGQNQAGGADQNEPAAVADPGQAQGLIHIVPFGRGSGAKNTFAPAGAHLTYWGGPVISNIHVVAVFWGPNVNTTITGAPGIGQFFTDITSSRYYDLLSEYSTVGVTGAGTQPVSSNQAIGHGTFDGKFTITPSLCPGPAACTVTDNQVAAELVSQINAGHLPQPVSDNQGNVNSFYMIYFPPGVTITLDALTRSCVQFCAYHSNTSAALNPKFVPYGVEPDFSPPSGCANGCGGNPVPFDNVTEVTSHEMSEAATDALVGSATVFGPPLAWYDPDPANNPLAEIGDICIGQGVAVPAGNTTYVVQKEFSNLQGDCVSAPPVFNLATPAGGVAPSVPFNATLTIQSSVSAFTLTGYRGTVHFTSSDPQAVLPADYTFVSGDAGAHQFSFTLNTLGDQIITFADTHSSGFNGTATVSVNTTPDLTITKSHTGNFSVGQTGAVYALTVSNTGHGPTSGAITVTDGLPSGLTATAISGTGWSCTLGTLTCTRADALAVGNSYPAITLTVNVAANAPPLVTNTATVSGGGETNVANDIANDPTTILAPDLSVFKFHFGPINGNFFQGETGATYTINVQNVGTLATSGTVTLVDTLPAGLTATAISGTGWSCTLATLTCTRSDALGSFSSYPSIILTVDVPLGAPANVTNTATVSGGGEVNTANDVSQDFTIILPPPAPDLSIGMFHGTTFIQGQTGTYQIGVSNVGTKITSGTVTVTDTLPTGLTATSMSGTGWSCTLSTPLICSRTDALDFNFGYPPIILTVNIAPDAPASVTNVATVSGGGDTNAGNNTAQDFTTIAPPIVDLTPQISGSNFLVQGQTNILEIVSVANFGNVSSSGVITVTNSLSPGLTATAIAGTGWSCTLNNLTCTRPDALGPSTSSTTFVITFNVANNAPTTGSLNATVSGGGDGSPGNNNAVLPIQINPMVLILPGNDNASVSAGQPARFAFTVNVLNQAAGTVNFSCSGLPALSSCSFNPPSLTSTAVVTMTVATTASSSVLGDDGRRLTPGQWLFVLLMGFGLLLTASLRRRAARFKRLGPALAIAGLLLIAGLSGCGGGSSTPITHSAGTPPGTYALTVTGTSANGTTTHIVNLTVR